MMNESEFMLFLYNNPAYTIVSRKRLKDLENSEKTLNALEYYGVDNWDAYDEAIKSLEDDE